jgi:copper/silver efflux system protein
MVGTFTPGCAGPGYLSTHGIAARRAGREDHPQHVHVRVSSIYIIFNDGIDFYWARTRILEKLNSLPAGLLPPGVQPALGPDATAMGQVFWYTLEGRGPDGEPVGGWDLHELRSLQDWHVRFALQAADGIAEVASIGGYVREYQVDVDPDSMRAHGVTLEQVFDAVRLSNLDVGARTIEINSVEYLIRGLGFIRSLEDLELAVVKTEDFVPIRIQDVAHVSLGPALRTGALDKGGAEAVGGVAVVRYGFNPLTAIQNVQQQVGVLAPALPVRPVFDWTRVDPAGLRAFAGRYGFEAYEDQSSRLAESAWLTWLRATPRDQWPEWINTSQVTIIPFYDRTGLIDETLGTLNKALIEQALVTILVVLVMVVHFRSALLISGMLPLAVLMAFIAMKMAGVEANVVALAGIAIAIGTIVDMGIIVSENILKHLQEADPAESRLEVVTRATQEVGSAVLTAIATTIVSFLPVFTMTGMEGKLFHPLAFTKTFVLIASVIAALAIIPAAAHVVLASRIPRGRFGLFVWVGLTLVGIFALGLAVRVGSFPIALAGLFAIGVALFQWRGDRLPAFWRRFTPLAATIVGAILVGYVLAERWLPLGPERGLARNLLFVGLLFGGALLFFRLFEWFYGSILRFAWPTRFRFLP